MLQNAYFLAKIGADTAENEQHFAEILPTDAAKLSHPAGRSRKMHFRKMHFSKNAFFEKCIFRKFCKFLAGSFSAVSKRIFARKYAFDSIFQALQDLHLFAPLKSQNFRKKNRFEKTAIFREISAKKLQMSQILQNFVNLQRFQLENLVDFEKCCKTHIFLQKSEPIQPKTSNILPKFCQPTLSDVASNQQPRLLCSSQRFGRRREVRGDGRY